MLSGTVWFHYKGLFWDMLNLRAYGDVMDRSTPSSRRTDDFAGPSVFSGGGGWKMWLHGREDPECCVLSSV